MCTHTVHVSHYSHLTKHGVHIQHRYHSTYILAHTMSTYSTSYTLICILLNTVYTFSMCFTLYLHFTTQWPYIVYLCVHQATRTLFFFFFLVFLCTLAAHVSHSMHMLLHTVYRYSTCFTLYLLHTVYRYRTFYTLLTSFNTVCKHIVYFTLYLYIITHCVQESTCFTLYLLPTVYTYSMFDTLLLPHYTLCSHLQCVQHRELRLDCTL